MPNQNQFVRRTAAVLLACGLTVGLADIAAIPIAEASAQPLEFFIAASGSDANPGSMEKPFATIERAQEAVRGVKGKNEARVFLRGGIYYRDQPVVFTAADSGTKKNPVTWAGYKDETVIISAGREIAGWKQKGGHWEAELPAVKRGEWHFGQLFTRDRGAEFFTRRYRPVKGMLAVAGHSTNVPPKDPRNSASPIKAWRFFPGDIGRWENMSNVEFVAFHSWSSSRYLPKRVDYENHEIEFTDYPHYRVTRWYGVHNPYYAENVKEEFGKPGEWYLDTSRGVLMYTPAAGETIENTTVVAPVLEQIMTVKGDYANNMFVEHLVFKNLSFMHMAWHIPPGGFGDYQSMFRLPANIECEGCENVTFERCSVAHNGAYGLGIDLGCHHTTVRGCTFYDCGGGAIEVGVLRGSTEEHVRPSFITVENCFIRDVGLLHFGVGGIASAATKSLHIRHNLIDGAPYHGMGLEIGGNAVGTIVERNEITNVLNLLEDGAAIYGHFQQDKTITADAIIRGNHIYNNHKSHVAAGSKLAGIYPDHGSWGCVVEDNVIYDIDGRPLFGTLDPGLARGRVNATPEEANTIRGNVIDVLPGDPGFPTDLVEQAGVEQEYEDIVRNDLPRALPQVYSMPLADTSGVPVDFFASFESYQPGQSPVELSPSRRQRNNYVEITGEDGCGGKRCLKFVDGPSKRSFFPLIRKGRLGVKTGVVRLSFDFKHSSDAPGRMYIEIRDGSQQYRVGPRIRLLPNGTITGGNNVEIAKVSLGQWAHLSIDLTLTPGPKKTFQATVIQGEMKKQKSFSFVHGDFETLEKLVFSADGNDPAVMYLDNIQFEVKK